MARASGRHGGGTPAPVPCGVPEPARASAVSPISRDPAGRLHRPRFGSAPRFTRRTAPSRNTIAPTAGTGGFGNSFWDDTIRELSEAHQAYVGAAGCAK